MKRRLIFFAVVSLFVTWMMRPVWAETPSETPARADVTMDKNVYFAYRSFWPEHEAMKEFFAAGVKTVCIFPSSTTNSLGEPYSKYPAVWRYPDTYDWESFDRQFDEIIALNSEVEFLCMVDLNTPIWLARMLGMAGDGNFDSFIDLTNCLTNPRWNELTTKYLDDFLAHAEAKYGDRIRAYILACGQTDEWMDYSAYRSSRAKNAAYAAWRSERGLPAENFATPDLLDKGAFENRIHDPSSESAALDTIAFTQELVADSILRFARRTKEATGGDKEVGVFFGYILELSDWRMTGCGHLAYEKVFADPAVDFFISPGTYWDRPIGGGSGFMAPNATRLLDNKGYMHEIDHRTTTYNCALNEFVSIGWMNNWKSPAENVAGMRREMALALVNHASCWFFDMWGGAHEYEGGYENIAAMKKIWDAFAADRSASAAEILLVADPQSAAIYNDRIEATAFFPAVRRQLNRLGAPFEICSFNDLDRLDLTPYKLVIFPGSFLITAERQKTLDEKVLCGGRTVLWLGPVGISDRKSLDVGRVERLTGVPYAEKELQKTERSGWTSLYLRDPWQAKFPLLKEAAVSAGVTIYCDEPIPVYANRRLVAIHVAQGGAKKISLPKTAAKVVELFSGKTVAENASEFVYEFAAPETALFELQ